MIEFSEHLFAPTETSEEMHIIAQDCRGLLAADRAVISRGAHELEELREIVVKQKALLDEAMQMMIALNERLTEVNQRLSKPLHPFSVMSTGWRLLELTRITP